MELLDLSFIGTDTWHFYLNKLFQNGYRPIALSFVPESFSGEVILIC